MFLRKLPAFSNCLCRSCVSILLSTIEESLYGTARSALIKLAASSGNDFPRTIVPRTCKTASQTAQHPNSGSPTVCRKVAPFTVFPAYLARWLHSASLKFSCCPWGLHFGHFSQSHQLFTSRFRSWKFLSSPNSVEWDWEHLDSSISQTHQRVIPEFIISLGLSHKAG